METVKHVDVNALPCHFAPGTAGYVASVASRLYRRYGRRPGWGVGLLAVHIGFIVVWICACAFQFDAFIPSRSATGGWFFELLVVSEGLSVVTSSAPAPLIVRHHGNIDEKTHPVAS